MPPSLLETLFTPPQFPTQFLAMGCLFGKFSPSEPTENKGVYLVRGTLQINQVVYLDVAIKSKVWLKLSQSPTFSLDNAYLWRVYFRTTPEGKLTLVELTRNVPIEGHLSLDNPPPLVTGVDQFYIRAEIQYANDQKVVLKVRRNQKPPKGQEEFRQWQPFLMTIIGSLSVEANKGDFWDFFCTRKGESLVLTRAQRVDQKSPLSCTTPADTLLSLLLPTQSDREKYFKQEEILLAQQRVDKKPFLSTPSNSNLSPNQVIMIPGKQPEITVKFNTHPALPEVGKVVTLEITSEQGLSIRANMKRKTLKKQVEKMDSFPIWIAILSGKVARIDPNGVIELEAATVVVFEKKPKAEAFCREVQVEV